MRAPTIVLGVVDDERTTHVTADVILSFFDISKNVLGVWRRRYGFPAPQRVYGVICYERAAVRAWKQSASAPRWVQGLERKPTGLKGGSYEAHVRVSGLDYILEGRPRPAPARKQRMDYDRALRGGAVEHKMARHGGVPSGPSDACKSGMTIS